MDLISLRADLSRQLGSATSRAGARCRQSKPAHKRPSGATQRKVASHARRLTGCACVVGYDRIDAGVAPQVGVRAAHFSATKTLQWRPFAVTEMWRKRRRCGSRAGL